MRLVPTIDVTATATGCQRWRERRPRHRPAGEPFEPGRYGLELLDGSRERIARDFVRRHHYAGSWPACRRAWGLYDGRQLVGAVAFSVPVQPRIAGALVPGLEAAAVVELGRLVLLDEVPGNAESWFVARALRALRGELPELGVVVSYSDPVVRVGLDGRRVLPGHVGVVYQALGAVYTGRGRRQRVILAPDGSVLGRRSLDKLRRGERGAAGAYEQLRAWGAPAMRTGEDGAAYVTRALEEGPFRAMGHPGCHRYAWALRPGLTVQGGQPYPRRDPEAGSAVASPRASTTGPVQLGLWGAA